ncbi:ROK family transcriptional regulator [Alkalihalobacillus sp. AL-G]|uniref:ROK family transcriptional regulator n=1 Tax=Alkalihalobacillus sp. AL-G TaxID=2926399 RepID=UPI002729FDB8|nr:ROK family transcriptional regulator [Alkalihalobacillus sp. AL-G]WLD92799.1 ROK family transcriptional regulator [Alkalihalobacillus sp. AL-G]
MHEGLRGSFQLMKSLNRSIILNKIRVEGPISRADIAKQIQLTPPTVSNIVKELIDTGFVFESKQGESIGGGRKPTLLELNARNFYIIGLDVGPKYLRTIMADLNGKLIESSSEIIPESVTNEGLIELMRNAIKNIIDNYQKEKEKFIGIGVGMHGAVDVQKGISLFAPSLHLRDIPIKEIFEYEFDMLVKVENDARAMALGESWFGNGNGSKNVITINVGRGIGAGVVLDGELFYGEHFIAGELGHMTIDLSGPKCDCGNYGCLQTLADGPAIARRAIKEISIGSDSILTDWVEGKLEQIDGELIYKAAERGDELCINILKQTGKYLGIGLTNLIHILNPERIVIGGGVSNSGEFILGPLKETIQKRVLTNAAKKTDIVLSNLGENGGAIGAVALILVEIFKVKN